MGLTHTVWSLLLEETTTRDASCTEQASAEKGKAAGFRGWARYDLGASGEGLNSTGVSIEVNGVDRGLGVGAARHKAADSRGGRGAGGGAAGR